MTGYGEDLAYIHDVGFGGFARDAAPALLALLRAAGVTSGTVLDLGCGSGIWARELLDAGDQVTGIDLSPAMIEIARRRAPEAAFTVGSFLDSRGSRRTWPRSRRWASASATPSIRGWRTASGRSSGGCTALCGPAAC